ncbi:MAG TPA: DUF6680 family protein [Candidatus Dormibacteraeota bacterium]|nr:DUF6680 family protein [Candidatus Dormibacteraeota bacterium]
MLTIDQWLVVISIVAIALGPIGALEVQKRLEDRRAIRERKMGIFRRLMTTRATQLSPVHVEALNGIEVEFYSSSGADKKVLDAWRLYIDHLGECPNAGGAALDRWVEKKQDLLFDLLYEMAQSLGYEFNKLTIKNNVYHPKGFVEIEGEQHALRKAALAVLSGERPVQTTVVGRVQTTAPLPPPDEVRQQPALAPAAPTTPQRPALPVLHAEVIPQPDERQP